MTVFVLSKQSKEYCSSSVGPSPPVLICSWSGGCWCWVGMLKEFNSSVAVLPSMKLPFPSSQFVLAVQSGRILCQSGEEESIIKKFNDVNCVLCTWGTRWCAAWYLVMYRNLEDSCFVAMYEVTALSSMWNLSWHLELCTSFNCNPCAWFYVSSRIRKKALQGGTVYIRVCAGRANK